MILRPAKTDNMENSGRIDPDWEQLPEGEKAGGFEENLGSDGQRSFWGSLYGFSSSLWHGAKQRLAGTKTNWIPFVLCLAVYTVLVFLMFLNASGAVRPGVVGSLRYEYNPLASETVQSAKRMLNQKDSTQKLSAAFWAVNPKLDVETSYGKAQTPVLFVDGDIPSVLKVNFLYGRYPAALENKGIALSEGLAWSIMGGFDIAGSEIEIEKSTYTITGVFEGDQNLMLVQDEAKDSMAKTFSGIELSGKIEQEPSEAAKQFVADLGLSEPDYVVSTGVLPGLISAFAWLPVMVLCLWMSFKLLSTIASYGYWHKQAVRFAVLLAAAILLPKALGMIPGWMVPSQWSDFEYWGKFFKEMNFRLTGMLSMKPSFSDVQVTRMLILQVIYVVPCMMSLGYLIRRVKASSAAAENPPEENIIEAELVDPSGNQSVILCNVDYQIADHTTPGENNT